MSVALALKKVLESTGEDPEHFLSAYPTHLLFQVTQVKGSSGGANGKTEYIGRALPGTLKGESKWQIAKNIYDSGGFLTDQRFADGDAKFNKVFDDGTSNYANDYTYSNS